MSHLRLINTKPCAAVLLFSLAVTAANGEAVQPQPSAQPLIDLGVLAGGTYSVANGVSGDGSVVVGFGDLNRSRRAFRWDAAGGMVSLGGFTGGRVSYAYGASADGSVVVGDGSSTNGYRAFRWDAAGGMVSLGVLTGGSSSFGKGVSGDGSVVVGYGDESTNGSRAFRWDAAGGMVSLGVFAGGSYSYGNGVSDDGSVVVGSGDLSNNRRAFRWDAAGGMVDLGVLTGGSFSDAFGVSGDGSVAVGYSSSTNGNRAFRWDAAGGMVSLGVLAGGSSSQATGVSDDGSVVVGYGDATNGNRAFIWRGAMLDLVNTQVAIGQSASDLAAAAEARNGAAVFSLGRELEVARAGTGPTRAKFSLGMPMAIRLEGALSGNQGVNNAASGGLSVAFGLGDKLTLGGFVSVGKEKTSYNTINQSGVQTNLGLYLRSRQPERLGLTWKLALAASAGDASITRAATLVNTEAGTGTAALSTYAASFELGYGLNVQAVNLIPFLRVSVSQSQRDGYTEGAAITFPVTYDAYTEAQATATLGFAGSTALTPNNELRFGGGVEVDISRSNAPVTGSSAIPGMLAFSIAAPTVLNASRGYLSAGYSHMFTNGAELSLNLTASQSAFATTPTYGVAMGYTVRF